MRRLPIAVLLACAAFDAGRAQSSSPTAPSGASVPVQPGERVRVTYPAQRVREGTVVSSAADGVVVRWTGTAESERVPLDSPIRLEVSRGKAPSRMARWSTIGLIGGLGAGWLVGSFVTTENCHNDTTSPGCTIKQDPSYVPFSDHGAAGALVGGLVGAVGGGVFGARRSEVWQRISIGPTRVGMTLPRGGQVRFGAFLSY